LVLKAVLFDVDGTLVDSNAAHAEAWSRAFRSYGYDVPADRLRPLIGMGGDKILVRIDSKLHHDGEPGASIARLRETIFLDAYVATLQPTRGARDLLERVAAAGLLRVAATSAKRSELGAILRAANLEGAFDAMTTSDDARRSKPDADILTAALAKISSNAAEAIYVGDTPYDIDAAHRAGMPAIGLRCGGSSDDRLAKADERYGDPADLLAHFEDSCIARRMHTAASERPAPER
jgi:HAD superfamily hydrolase (TIGR01509 family)